MRAIVDSRKKAFLAALSKEQAKSWITQDFLTLTTPDNLIFRIYDSTTFNVLHIVPVRNDTVHIASLCFQVRSTCWDTWLAQKIALEAVGGLDYVLSIANVNIYKLDTENNTIDQNSLSFMNDPDSKKLVSDAILSFLKRCRSAQNRYSSILYGDVWFRPGVTSP